MWGGWGGGGWRRRPDGAAAGWWGGLAARRGGGGGGWAAAAAGASRRTQRMEELAVETERQCVDELASYPTGARSPRADYGSLLEPPAEHVEGCVADRRARIDSARARRVPWRSPTTRARAG